MGMGRKNTEEKIYESAFKLFMQRPYELVTIRDIEKAIGMTRGAIFYYVRDKEQLYREVMERYFLNSQNLYSKIGLRNIDTDMSLLTYINVFLEGVVETTKEIGEFSGILKKDKTAEDKDEDVFVENLNHSYFSLMINTGYYLEDFNVRMRKNFKIDINTWNFFIKNAVDRGEIKPDVNCKLLSEQFTYLYLGLAVEDSLGKGLDVEHLRELYMELYNNIKL